MLEMTTNKLNEGTTLKVDGNLEVTGDVKLINKPKLKIVKMFDDVKLPEKKNKTDSGFDLYAYSFKQYYHHNGSNGERLAEGDVLNNIVQDSSIELCYLERVLIGTGIKATVGPGYEIQVRSRSGLALKQGLTVLNSPGTVDADYRDEFGVILVNLSRQTKTIKLGERIAQIVVCPVELPEIEVVSNLDDNNRGGGFGSTGIK